MCVFVCMCLCERERGIAHKERDTRIQNYKTGEENERIRLVRERKSVCERGSVFEREIEKVCVAGVDAREEAKTIFFSFFASIFDEEDLRSRAHFVVIA